VLSRSQPYRTTIRAGLLNATWKFFFGGGEADPTELVILSKRLSVNHHIRHGLPQVVDALFALGKVLHVYCARKRWSAHAAGDRLQTYDWQTS
jgi:hypothetical protein